MVFPAGPLLWSGTGGTGHSISIAAVLAEQDKSMQSPGQTSRIKT